MAETQEKKTIVIDSLTPEQEALIQSLISSWKNSQQSLI